MHLSLYALGGGLGHLVRNLGLARAASARGHRVEILCNSPWASYLLQRSSDWILPPSTQLNILPADLPIDQARQQALDWVKQPHWDALVVDTFPRGLGGELADWLPHCQRPTFFTHRDLTPAYVAEKNLFESVAHFDRIFLPGERGPLAELPGAFATAPWLICDSDSMLPRQDALQQLNAPDDERPMVLVAGAGNAAETREMAQLAEQLHAMFLDVCHIRYSCLPLSQSQAILPHSPASHSVELWPTLPCLDGVDLLIGSGGYNTVYEARATGTPLLAIPRKRKYDRQHLRLSPRETVSNTAEIPQQVHQWLTERHRTPIHTHQFTSGTHAAIQEIETLLPFAP